MADPPKVPPWLAAALSTAIEPLPGTLEGELKSVMSSGARPWVKAAAVAAGVYAVLHASGALDSVYSVIRRRVTGRPADTDGKTTKETTNT